MNRFNPLLSEVWFATPAIDGQACIGLGRGFNPLLSEAWFATQASIEGMKHLVNDGL